MADVKFGAILQNPSIPEVTVMFLRRGEWSGRFQSFEAVLLTDREYPRNYTLMRAKIGSVQTCWTVESWTLLHE